jgi:tRNA(Arg) A34 adenosine deaminase TadA
MCLGAIYWSRSKKLFFAADKNDAAEAGFDDYFIYKEIDLTINKRFITTKILKTNNKLEPFKLWNNLNKRINY